MAKGFVASAESFIMSCYGNVKDVIICYQIHNAGKLEDYAIHVKEWNQAMNDSICQSCGETIPHSVEHANSCLAKLSKIVRLMLKWIN